MKASYTGIGWNEEQARKRKEEGKKRWESIQFSITALIIMLGVLVWTGMASGM